MTIKHGCSRIVFLIGSHAIKIPNFTYSWSNFITGLMANIIEVQAWRYSQYDEEGRALSNDLLCPVTWSSLGSWVIVMKKVDRMCTRTEFDILTHRHRKHFPGDDKPDNYGWIGNKLVKLDYGP